MLDRALSARVDYNEKLSEQTKEAQGHLFLSVFLLASLQHVAFLSVARFNKVHKNVNILFYAYIGIFYNTDF